VIVGVSVDASVGIGVSVGTGVPVGNWVGSAVAVTFELEVSVGMDTGVWVNAATGVFTGAAGRLQAQRVNKSRKMPKIRLMLRSFAVL
jgi:hypothetical protein